MQFRDLRDQEEGQPLGDYQHSLFPLLRVTCRAYTPCVELATSGLTMGWPSTFSSATLPWGTGKWPHAETGHPEGKSQVVFHLAGFFFP